MSIKNYTYNDIKILNNQINKLNNKKYLVEIYNIIYKYDKDKIKENPNEFYIKFNKLSNQSYFEIENYLNSLDNPFNNNLIKF